MAFEGLNYPCWELLDCQGEVPQSRSGHTCALYNNRYLYIFGGFDGSSCFDDLYVLDLETRLWRRIEAGGDRPSGRASHSAVTDQLAGVMYIFGGSGSHFGYTNKRDLCEFCFETECWRLLSNPVEDTPSARYGQSMVAYQQGLYVWGGTHGTNYPTDMYRFDLCTKQWEYLITSGDCPCGRYRHQAMVKDDLMYIVGGSGINRYGDVWTFHFGTNVWRRVNCSGTDLSDGRYAHSAVLREGFIYLYGGNDTVRHDDLLQLDLETKIWSRVLVHGKDCPPGRDFHAAVLRKDSMVVFGGSNGMRRHNDVFEFHMAPKIPPCSLSSDLEATFEAAQTQDVIQRSCNIFLAANDSDWVHGVFCHEHLIQVRCPHLYRLVQDRVNGAASGSDTAEQDDNLDSLLRAVKDDNVKAPRHAPPGWMASECSSHCHWIPVDLPHIILHHFLLFLYSDSTRFGHLSMDPWKLHQGVGTRGMRLLSVCGKALFFIFPVGAGHPFRHGTLLQGFLQGEEGAEASNHSANEALVPHTLQLLGVALGRSVKASPDTSLVIVTLLGLPFVLTILAFFILGRLSEEKPPYPQRGAAMAGGDARFPPRSVPGSAFPSRPGTATGGLRPHGGFPMNGETSVPPTLPVLTSSRSLPMRQSPDLIDEDTRQSPLTMALFVKNPQGVAVRLDGTLSPTPENRTVNVVRVKDNSVILSAKVVENADSSTISLMVPSKDGQAEVIAMLDTRDALLSPNGVSRSIKRQVALHRVDVYGPHEEPCAWIMPAAGPGTFFVYYSPMDGIQRPDPAMTIFTKGTEVDRITESQGNVIAASDSTAAAVAPRGHRGGLWVKEGTDMALVTCLALAVQKLGSAWTSRMLVGRPRAVCGPC